MRHLVNAWAVISVLVVAIVASTYLYYVLIGVTSGPAGFTKDIIPREYFLECRERFTTPIWPPVAIVGRATDQSMCDAGR